MDEQQLRAMFEENYERLRLEAGHSLAPDVRESAWEQVRLYWRKLRPIAERVTDTEVKLNLPNQVTRKKRVFCIEGVVDIVREGDKVTMYDVKTHQLEFVRANIDAYRDQLNVYAHIWQNLRKERLDEAAIIATPVPTEVTAAIRSGDVARIDAALTVWEPVVPIEFNAANVHETISQFADTVDAIEDHEFRPPPIAALLQRDNGVTFATRVCRNCDVRFSCASYREYARRHRDRNWTKFADFYDFAVDEAEMLARFDAISVDAADVAMLGEE